MYINSSARDLLVHVDFPVRDISDAREWEEGREVEREGEGERWREGEEGRGGRKGWREGKEGGRDEVGIWETVSQSSTMYITLSIYTSCKICY